MDLASGFRTCSYVSNMDFSDVRIPLDLRRADWHEAL